MDAPLRIALLGTPRSGNTWLRLLVGAATGIPTVAMHERTDSALAELPRECVVQIHWRREPDFLNLLAAHGFRVLTIARHPLDVLVSILQFAIHDSESDRWLLGRGGDESGLFGAMPGSRAFAEYGTGDRARELFGVTGDWWEQPGATSVRFEELVRDPIGQLLRLRNLFRPDSTADLSEIVARHELAELRTNSFNSHFWKGQPGLWRQLLTAEIAGEIAAFRGDAAIYIRPPFAFRAVTGMVTNFHLPRTTLLLLVQALSGGELLRRAYAEAVENDYRFYSYGDAMLVL